MRNALINYRCSVMVTCRSPKALLWVRVLPPVHGSLVKWIITQRYGRWVKGSNPLGAT